MGIFNIFGKKDVSAELVQASPYRISTEWVPYRLYANRQNSVSLMVKVKNMTSEVLLTSVVAELPKQLGFDEMRVAKERELRLGKMAPNEEREVRFEVFSDINSDAGEYTVTVTSIAHYLDYGHVINAVKKRTTVGVV
jgi:uncharacterized membrane protein